MAMSMALRSKLRSLTGTGGAGARLLRSTVAVGRSFSDCPNPEPEPKPEPEPLKSKTKTKTKTDGGEIDTDFIQKLKAGLAMHGDKAILSMNASAAQTAAALGIPEEEEDDEPPRPSSPRDAQEIFKEMKEAGLVPSAVAMLDGLSKDGRVNEAMKLFGLMREKGSMPEVIVYTAVVDGFCKAHKMDDAIRVFKKMEANGVVANSFSYQVLIRGLCACGGKERLKEAFAFTMEMFEAGYSPNFITFVGLVDGYCREFGLEEAQTVIKELRAKGFSFEEKPAKEYLDKKGPFLPMVWEAILGKKNPSSIKTSAF